MSGRKNAIVIVVDGLQAGMLGCYGNTWIKTPEIDRLASESFLFDQAILDTSSPPLLFDAHWSGSYAKSWTSAWRRHSRDPNPASMVPRADLFEILTANGIRAQVVTDDLTASQCASNVEHSNVLLVPPRKGIGTVDSWEESQMATLFATATEWVADVQEPFCLWLHSWGMKGLWDAPYELRQQYADVEDPLPPTFVEWPSIVVPENHDPDELLGIQQAYAGQVSLMDTCCGAFIEAFRESRFAENTLFMLLGASGFSLGEHRVVGDDCSNTYVGDDCGRAYSEMIQVPWLIRSPNDQGRASRTSALIQPPDLYATLLDWFDAAPQQCILGGKSLWPLIQGNVERIRDRAGYFANDEWSLRTEKWHLRSSGGDESKAEPRKLELFVKPDDRFEVNDVSSRCPEVVAALEEAWRDLVAVAESGRWDELPPLPEAATRSVD